MESKTNVCCTHTHTHHHHHQICIIYFLMAGVFEWLNAHKIFHELCVCAPFDCSFYTFIATTYLAFTLLGNFIFFSYVLSRSREQCLILTSSSYYVAITLKSSESLASYTQHTHTQLTPMILVVIIFRLIFVISDVGLRSYSVSGYMKLVWMIPYIAYCI